MSAKKVNQIWRALNKEGQPQHQLLPFPIATDDASSFQTSDLFNSSHGQAATRKEPHEYSEQHQQYERPCDLFSLQANKYSTGIIFKDKSSCDNVSVTDRISNAPIKWMSSKMRLMRKMMAREQIKIKQPRRRMQPPQGQSLLNPEIYNGNISPSGIVIIRVCSDCNTTKTPLWRSGPKGPKSLCNACGIRQMKARRAMTASASVLNDALIMRKRKTLHVDRTMPYKKRYKFTNPDADHAKLQFNHTAIGLKESTSSFHQTFPQDEKDAAILLMTLSCG